MSYELDAFTYGTLERQNAEMERISMNTLADNASNLIGSSQLGNAALGMHTGAQHSILVSNAAISNTPLVMKSSPIRPSRVGLGLNIIQAENGFIVNIDHQYGGLPDSHIAATIEDVNTIITAQLASRMLDRTE